MNLFNRLTQQAQESYTQITPRSCISRYEESPLLEQQSFFDNSQASPISIDNINLHRQYQEDTNRSAQADVPTNSNNQHASDNMSHPDVSIETKQTDKSPAEDSVAKLIVPLPLPDQDKTLALHQNIINTQKPIKNESVRQKDEQVAAYPKTETRLNQDRVTGAINVNLHLSEPDSEQGTEMVREFQPLIELTPPGNQYSDLPTTVEKPIQSQHITPAPVEVHVSIGRIQVKNQRETTLPVKQKKAKPKAPMSLASYLADREVGKR